jgi:hypothetical protein
MLWRYRDKDNYYLFTMDDKLSARRLVRVANGLPTVLASDRGGFTPYRWYDLECSAIGDRLRVMLDGQVLFDVQDSTHVRGKVGLGTWLSSLVAFDRLRVYSTAPDERSSFEDHFEAGNLEGWTVRDDGNQFAPSAWQPTGGAVWQNSPIGGSGSNRPGTLLYRTDQDLADMAFAASVFCTNAGSLGLVFRVRGAGATYYRFQIDQGSKIARLEKVVAQQHTLLVATPLRAFDCGRWYELEVVAVGDRLAARLDGAEVLAVRDAEILRGGIGFYSHGGAPMGFDDAVLRQASAGAPATGLSGKDRRYRVTFHVPDSNGNLAFLLLAEQMTPPIDLRGLDPLGRLLPLAVDPLFAASARLGLLSTFDGADTAVLDLQLPKDPHWLGRRLFVGGVQIGAAGRVLPLATAPLRVR